MIARILRGVGRRLGIYLYVVKARPLRTQSPVPRRDIEFRELSMAECLRASSDPALDLSAEVVRDAAVRGDVCVGAFDSGRLVAYSWFASETAAVFDGVWIGFDGPAMYIYKAFVLPDARGRHIA